MMQLARALFALALIASAFASRAHAGSLLRYGGHRGQVAVYRLSVSAVGQQMSLGERRPVSVEAEFELREEITATGPAGAITARIVPVVISTRDSAGAFGNGERSIFPTIEVTIDERGQVLATRPLSDEHVGPYQRAFASLIAAPGAVMPTGPAMVGDSWTWESDGSRQTSRLAAVRHGSYGVVARVETAMTAPIRLQEESVGLGLKTSMSGNETETSVLDMLVDTGVVLRNKGVARSATKEQVVLQLAHGPKAFLMASDITVSFDLRLVRLDGKPIRSG